MVVSIVSIGRIVTVSEPERFSHYIAIPKGMADKAKRRRELDALRRARYVHRHPEKAKTSDKRKRHDRVKVERVAAKLQSDFIFWDGETPHDAGYALFGNNAGFEICHPYISTLECLELIMETELEYPDAIHISFGFTLDVSYILKDLPRRCLTALHNWGKVVWEDWELEHIPHKWFTVKHGSIKARIFDVHTFFMGNYVSALVKFNVGSSADLSVITSGKAMRKDFMWADIDEIREYWRIEIKLGPALGDAVRDALGRASYVPRSWHGPGAVARMALKRHGVYDAMAKCPTEVRLAARYAFIGGRFEPVMVGLIPGPIYEADINSAYPYYAMQLPNLAKGKWRHGKAYEPGKFALYNIRYDAPYDPVSIYPLPRRYKDHSVGWVNKVEGWYWGPEAELVADDPNAIFLGSLVFDEDNPNDRPFTFLGEYYLKRKQADARGDILGYPFKIIINAIFGQLAQRAGWDRKNRLAPRSHQLEWAGYITSACRAAVYKAAVQCGDKLISINTDSVQARCPLDFLEHGSAIGQWGMEEYSEGIVWQSGIYYLREELGYDPALGYGWVKAKTRGIPRGAYTPEQLIEAVRTQEPLTIVKHNFYPYTLADNSGWDKLNTWIDEPTEYYMGGNGKRSHLLKDAPTSQWCDHHCEGLMHRLRLTPAVRLADVNWESDTPLSDMDSLSVPHYLPWLDGPDSIKGMMQDLEIWDLEALDPDEEWVREYA